MTRFFVFVYLFVSLSVCLFVTLPTLPTVIRKLATKAKDNVKYCFQLL